MARWSPHSRRPRRPCEEVNQPAGHALVAFWAGLSWVPLLEDCDGYLAVLLIDILNSGFDDLLVLEFEKCPV